MKFLSFLGFLAIVSGQSNNEKAQSLDFWIKISGKTIFRHNFWRPNGKSMFNACYTKIYFNIKLFCCLTSLIWFLLPLRVNKRLSLVKMIYLMNCFKSNEQINGSTKQAFYNQLTVFSFHESIYEEVGNSKSTRLCI